MTILAALLAGALGSAPHQTVDAPLTAAIGIAPIPLRKKGLFYQVELSAFGGKPGWFNLDTGGYRSYVTAQGLARLKRQGAKTERGEAFVATSVILGGYPLPPIEFVLDKKAGRVSLDPESDGVVGADVLSRFRVGLDLGGLMMRLWPADAAIGGVIQDWFGKSIGTSSYGIAKLSFWNVLGGLFATSLTVNGDSLGATVDTGSTVSLVDAQFAGKAFEGLKKTGEYRVWFYDGPARVERFEAEGRLRLGDLTLQGKREIGRTQTPNGAGSILGCDVLADLRVLLDFPGHGFYAKLSPPSRD